MRLLCFIWQLHFHLIYCITLKFFYFHVFYCYVVGFLFSASYLTPTLVLLLSLVIKYYLTSETSVLVLCFSYLPSCFTYAFWQKIQRRLNFIVENLEKIPQWKLAFCQTGDVSLFFPLSLPLFLSLDH